MLFLEEFEENVERAGEALDDDGFDLYCYGVSIGDDERQTRYDGDGDSIEEAYREAVTEIGDSDVFRIDLPSSRLASCITGDGSFEEVFSGVVYASITLDEPRVEREWGEDLAFFTNIRYYPAISPRAQGYDEGYFSIENFWVRYPYEGVDGEKRLGKISNILESDGFDVKNLGNNATERDPDNYSTRL